MTKYKNIEKYMPELKMFPINMKEGLTFSEHGIKASDLEALLANGVEVYGFKDICDNFLSPKETDKLDCTHSGLLLSYKPIESQEPVSKVNVAELKNELIDMFGKESWQVEYFSRIEKNGVKND